MELLEFIKVFDNKPLNHKIVWFNILSKIQSDTNKIELYKFIKDCKVSKASFYRIFKIYNNDININKITYNFSVENNSILIDEKTSNKKVAYIANKGKSQDVWFSESIKECYNKCLLYFPAQLHPKDKVIKTWLSTIDKLNRIDKVPLGLIVNIVAKTRNDDFWSKNFLSITKLRKKNGDGVMYIIVFNEKFNKVKTNKIEKAHETISKAKQFNWEGNN